MNEGAAMTARDVHEHMKQVAPWVEWDGRTCDGFKYGDPDAEVASRLVSSL